jgi:hypothetical protein
MSEDKFELAVDNFFDWGKSTELAVSIVFVIIFFIIALILFKKDKQTPGWIFMAIGIITLLSDVIRLIL